MLSSYISALITALLVPFLHIGIVRLLRDPDHTTPFALLVFCVSFLIWIVVFLSINQVQSYPPLTEWVAGISLLGLLELGYLEIIFNVYRGFSFSIITGIVQKKRMTASQVMNEFADGTGMNGMFERRIRTMQHIGFFEIKGNQLSLKSKGRIVGRIGLLCNKIWNLDFDSIG